MNNCNAARKCSVVEVKCTKVEAAKAEADEHEVNLQI